MTVTICVMIGVVLLPLAYIALIGPVLWWRKALYVRGCFPGLLRGAQPLWRSATAPASPGFIRTRDGVFQSMQSTVTRRRTKPLAVNMKSAGKRPGFHPTSGKCHNQAVDRHAGGFAARWEADVVASRKRDT
jgi:hypothetical protein